MGAVTEMRATGTCLDTGDEIKVTTNLYLAAAYLMAGARMFPEGCNRSDPKRIKLAFKGKGLSKIEAAWWSGDSLERRFSECIRDAKDFLRM